MNECVDVPPAGSSYAPPMALQRVPLLAPHDPSGFQPLCYHGLLSTPLGGPHLASGLTASPSTMQAEAGLLESSALWDMSYGGRAMRAAPDLSSGSSGYQSGTSHTGRGPTETPGQTTRCLQTGNTCKNVYEDKHMMTT